MHLLAAILQTACEQLDTDQQQLALLVRLATVCRHWQAASADVARCFTSVQLFGSSLTPALSGRAGWTTLILMLDARGVSPGLADFMRSTSALTEVDIYLCSDVIEAADIVAVHKALAVAPAVVDLTCNSLRPTAFPTSLTHLILNSGIEWADGELEDMMVNLSLLPSLRYLDIELFDCSIQLSEERLSGIRLPSLWGFWLRLTEGEPRPFDLSWLADRARRFELVLVLESDDSADGLLNFSNKIRSVLQPIDSLHLDETTFFCEPAQEVLSGLKLWQLNICTTDVSSLIVLPPTEHIRLCVKLNDWNLTASELQGLQQGTMQFEAHLSWAAVTSARQSCEVSVNLEGLSRIEAAKCFTQLHVSDVFVGPAAWQQSLSEPQLPWTLRFVGWDSMSGLPAATSRTNDIYELRNQAAVSMEKS